MRDYDELYRLEDVDVIKVTEKAVLVLYEGEERWIPKSIITDPDPDDLEEGDEREEIEVPMWFAKKEGICDE